MVEAKQLAELVTQTMHAMFGLVLPAEVSWDPFHEQWRVGVDQSHCKDGAYQAAYCSLVDLLVAATEDNYRITDSDRHREQKLIRKHGKPEYDALILHDFTQHETVKHRAFYQGLAATLRATGKTAFLPAEWFGLADDEQSQKWFANYDEGCKDCYTMTNHLVLPAAKLVVVDLGHVPGSEDVGVPFGRATAEGKHVIFIAPNTYHFETVQEVYAKTWVFGARGRKEDYPENVLLAPYISMHKKSFTAPLKPYPRLWEIIRYGIDEEGFSKLGTSVAKFFEANP